MLKNYLLGTLVVTLAGAAGGGGRGAGGRAKAGAARRKGGASAGPKPEGPRQKKLRLEVNRIRKRQGLPPIRPGKLGQRKSQPAARGRNR